MIGPTMSRCKVNPVMAHELLIHLDLRASGVVYQKRQNRYDCFASVGSEPSDTVRRDLLPHRRPDVHQVLSPPEEGRRVGPADLSTI